MIHVNCMVKQRGFSLVAAIFILIILSMMGSYMVSTSVMQAQTADYALQGARAYRAAQSGIQWAVRRVLKDGDYLAVCGAGPAGDPIEATTNFALNANGLNGFTTEVTCSWTRHSNQGDNFCMFRINTRATFGIFGEPDFISRRLEVLISDNPPVSGC